MMDLVLPPASPLSFTFVLRVSAPDPGCLGPQELEERAVLWVQQISAIRIGCEYISSIGTKRKQAL